MVGRSIDAGVSRRWRLLLSVIATALLATVLSPVQLVAAQSQNEIVVSVNYDGTDFDTDPLDDGAGVHTPGLDAGPDNLVVKTFDQYSIRVDWTINEDAATTPTIVIELPGHSRWSPDSSGMFAGCDVGASSISADELTLTCVLEDQPEGSNGAIRPVAQLLRAADGETFSISATLTTDDDATGVSDAQDTPLVVSERPYADWVKEAPEVAGPVSDGSTSGYVLLYPITLTDYSQGGDPILGAGYLDDSQALDLNDHAWRLTANAALASSAQMTAAFPGRAACGTYDGVGAYPATVGTMSCGAVTSPNGYPVVPISITGWSQVAPAANADGSVNEGTPRYVVDAVRSGMRVYTGQIGFWIPESEYDAEVASASNVSVGRARFTNTVSSDPAATAITSQNDATSDALPGHGGPTPELAVLGDTDEHDQNTRDAYLGTSPVSSTAPGAIIGHGVHFYPGPMQLLESSNPDSRRWLDMRDPANGGIGLLPATVSWDHANDQRGDYIGKTPRGADLTVTGSVLVASISDNGTPLDAPIHGCFAFDTTHYNLVTAPASIPVAIQPASIGINRNSSATVGGTTAARNAGPVAHVLTGYAQSNRGPTGAFGGPEFPFTIEFTDAPLQIHPNPSDPHPVGGTAGTARTPFGAGTDGLTCADADAGPSGWVDGKDAAAMATFDTASPGDGVFEGITRARISIPDGLSWESHAVNGVKQIYHGFRALFAARVKTDLTLQKVDSELFVMGSHSYGDPVLDADGALLRYDLVGYEGDTQVDHCRPWGGSKWTDTNDLFTSTGWCNQEFEDDGIDSLDVNDIVDWDDRSSSAQLTLASNGITTQLRASGDTAVIVEAQLRLEKDNLDGVADVADNGELVQFSLKPSVVGSPLEALTNVRLTDALPANYQFVRFVSQPVTGPGCMEASGTITCQFSEPVPGTDSDPSLPDGIAGGWSDEVIIEVMVTGAVANPTTPVAITNTARVDSDGIGPWDEVNGEFSNPTQPAAKNWTSSASSFLPLPADEGLVIKNVATLFGPCVDHPSGVVPAGWGGRCSLTDWDDDDSNLTALDADGNMSFTLSLNNHGNTEFTDIEFVDVFPHNGDSVEPASGTNISGGSPTTLGDGRDPATTITGQVGFVSLTPVSVPSGATVDVWVTGDAPGGISRDPLKALDGTVTWCTPAGVVQVGAGSCPVTDFDVTATYAKVSGAALAPDETIELELTLDSETVDCADIWTNTFGARVAELALPIRSNDVSVMVACPEVGLAKEASTPVNNGDGTWNVTYTLTATNTGPVDLSNVAIVDDLATVFGSALTSSTVTSDTCPGATLAPGDTCELVIDVVVTPGSNPGPYDNTATVTADGALGGSVDDDSQDGTDVDPDADGDPTNNDVPTSVSFVEMPEITATKTVTAGPVDNGDGTWTVTYDMTIANTGDVDLTAVSATDDLAAVFGSGATITVDSVSATAPGTANPAFDGVGDVELLTATDLAVGESSTITLTITVTPEAAGSFANKVTVTGDDPSGDPVTDVSQDGTDGDPDADGDPTNNDDPTIVVIAVAADDDEDLDNESGTVVTVDPLGNDSQGLDPTTVELIDPDTGSPVTELTVAGEGVWSVDPVSGEITFTPESGFTGDPTPVDYRVGVLDAPGVFVEANVVITYLAPASTPAPPPALAFTGRTTDWALRVGLALLIVGAAFVAVEQRDRRRKLL